MAEQTGAAFGIYPSSGRRPERLNQSRGVNAPLQLARGWAAGLLGLPGDIEGLVRMLPGIQNETPVLPTSDFYREYLPGYDPRPAARAMSGLGALTGGAGATSVVRGGLGAVKRATDLNAIRDYVRAAQGVGGLPGTAVVKPKGGNWISGAGSPEEAVRGLKATAVGMDPAERIPFLDNLIREQEAAGALASEFLLDRMRAERGRLTGDAELNRWIDQKLAKYIRNEMGTPEDPLRAQVEAFPARRAELLAAKDAQLAKARADMERAQAARGVAPEVLTQSQARIRDLERERALIEPMTGLHFTPENVFLPADTAFQRQAAGYPRHGMAESQLAADWEALADAPISSLQAGKLAPQFLKSDPWLAKVPPETPVYSMVPGDTIRNQNLGFGHLVDELRNAVREGSDLPAELRLTPEQLGKMNVPAAAAHVDRVNAWRAAQKAEADLARAGNAATVEYKTYDTVPGTALPNERGLRWVELRTPEESAALPEGYSLSTITNENLPPGHMGRNSYAVVDPQGRMLEDVGLSHTEADAMDKFKRSYYGRTLEDALKYEGEVMGHCVGGYCPDVMEGRSRIFSLRDAKGQPHVTVEVRPDNLPNKFSDLWDIAMTHVPENSPGWEQLAEYGDDAYELFRQQHGRYLDDPRSVLEDILQYFPEAAEKTMAELNTPNIVQIKGKANKAPKDEYLPYVQDFVKSGQWSDVGDLQNTGLLKIGDKYIDKAKYKSVAGDLNPDYFDALLRNKAADLSADDARILQQLQEPGFARGGAVRAPAAGPLTYDPDRIAALAEQLTMEA